MNSTEYKYIYYVPKDFQISQDIVTYIDGYVWFDETECLGSDKIHPTIEECKKELDLYCEYLNKGYNEKTSS